MGSSSSRRALVAATAATVLAAVGACGQDLIVSDPAKPAENALDGSTPSDGGRGAEGGDTADSPNGLEDGSAPACPFEDHFEGSIAASWQVTGVPPKVTDAPVIGAAHTATHALVEDGSSGAILHAIGACGRVSMFVMTTSIPEVGDFTIARVTGKDGRAIDLVMEAGLVALNDPSTNQTVSASPLGGWMRVTFAADGSSTTATLGEGSGAVSIVVTGFTMADLRLGIIDASAPVGTSQFLYDDVSIQ